MYLRVNCTCTEAVHLTLMLLGRTLGMSNVGRPNLKKDASWSLHFLDGQEAHGYATKTNHRDCSGPGPQRIGTNHWGASPTPPHVPLMQSCVFQVTSGSQGSLTAYTYSALSGYNRLNYGKDIHLSLLSWDDATINQNSPDPPACPVLHGPRCAPSPSWPWGTPVCIPSPDWWEVQAQFYAGVKRRGEMGSQVAWRSGLQHLSAHSLVWGSVLSCLLIKVHLSRAVTEL